MSYNDKNIDFYDEMKWDSIKEEINSELDGLSTILSGRVNYFINETNNKKKHFFEEIEYPQRSSTISKILDFQPTSIKQILFLKKISEKYGVSLNWLVGLLPFEVKQDKHEDIYKYLGLSEDSINVLHGLYRGDITENKIKEQSNYPKYTPYTKTLDNVINSDLFNTILDDLRLIDLNTTNSNIEDIGYGITSDGTHIQLNYNMAKEFLIQKACSDFRKMIEDIYK